MVTRNGVYYDLNKSVYKFKIPSSNMVFVFSSDLHMIKFIEQYETNRKEQNIKFNSRYRLNIGLSVLHDLILYRKIETRGFLVFNCEGEKLCQENLILNGEKATLKS